MTLTEKCTLSNPTFLFRFISEGNMNEVTCIMADISSYPDRYNKFTFTEGTTATLTSGIWEYRVYEQTSPSNTNWQQATNVVPVEIGLMSVTGTPSVTFTPSPATNTFTWQTAP